MNLGQRLRELRRSKQLTLRQLAERVGVGFTYISKIENGKLEPGHKPSERLIHMLAAELNGNEEELMLLAELIPERVLKRFNQRQDVFLMVANLDDAEMDRLAKQLAR